MLALRFCPGRLSEMDRAQWLEPKRRERWRSRFPLESGTWANDLPESRDYKNFTSLFAFRRTMSKPPLGRRRKWDAGCSIGSKATGWLPERNQKEPHK